MIKISQTEKIEIIVWIDDLFFVSKTIHEANLEEQLRLCLTEGVTRVENEYMRTWYPPHRVSKVEIRKMTL